MRELYNSNRKDFWLLGKDFLEAVKNDGKEAMPRLLFIEEEIDEAILKSYYENMIDPVVFEISIISNSLKRLLTGLAALKSNNYDYVIFDSNIWSSIHFIKALKDNYPSRKKEFEVLIETIEKLDYIKPKYFHLDRKPIECYNAIQQRARPGENAISLYYLELLDKHLISRFVRTQADVKKIERGEELKVLTDLVIFHHLQK